MYKSKQLAEDKTLSTDTFMQQLYKLANLGGFYLTTSSFVCLSMEALISYYGV